MNPILEPCELTRRPVGLKLQRVTKPAPVDLRDIEDFASDALSRFGLAEKGWVFSWDRASRRAGACFYHTKRISLSRVLFSIEANLSEAHDTVLHEIAHALAGRGAGHGLKWRLMAEKVGARPERCHSLQSPEAVVMGVCGCGPKFERMRMPGKRQRLMCRSCETIITWHRRKPN